MVTLDSVNSLQYTIPTTGEVSMIRFMLKATNGCCTAESLRYQYIYRQVPGEIPFFNMREIENCNVQLEWGAALTTGTGNVFRYVIEIKDKSPLSNGAWRMYPGCGFIDNLTTCQIPMSTFQTFYGYEVG